MDEAGEAAGAIGQASGGLSQGSGLDRLRALALHTPYRLGFPDGPDIAVGERLQPSCGRTADSMPRQRIHHSRVTYQVPDDFPERLKEESGLTWAELNRRLGVHPYTMRRWVLGRARPGMRYMRALLALADSLGLGHIFRD